MLDVRMPEMNGLEVQRQLKRARHRITHHLHHSTRRRAPTCAVEFQGRGAGVSRKTRGPCTSPQSDSQRTWPTDAKHQKHGEFAARIRQLTPAEIAVFNLLITGKSLKEIAKTRSVTVQTAWKHRLSILQKMGVKSDLELVRIAAPLAGNRFIEFRFHES